MTAKPKEIRWRLRVMMAERNIKTATDLGRRLREVGLEISSQQLARVVNDMPQRMNTDLLAGLLTVLDCTPDDLLEVKEPESNSAGKEKIASGTPRATTPQRRRAPRPSIPVETDDDITGPTVAPFPLSKLT
jgi:DNA-binding Xre family transcriptional regulator